MNADWIISNIKILFIILFSTYIARKLINRQKYSKLEIIIILINSTIMVIIYNIIRSLFNTTIAIGSIYIIAILTMKFLNKDNKIFTPLVVLISYAICTICFGISTILSFISYGIIYKVLEIKNNYFNLAIILLFQLILIYSFFKIKRFKNGFSFVQNKTNNDFINIIVLNISIIVLLLYSLLANSSNVYNKESVKGLFGSFIIISVTMIITIQRTFTMYYKQKLMKQTLEDYEREIKEKDDEIKRLKNEKFNISKITHEFYNRQKALEMAIEKKIAKDNKIKEDNTKASKEGFNIETSEEIEALDRIKELTNEYSQKLKAMQSLPNLPLTEVTEIDDMFKYMQTECNKNNIEFKLKISGNIFYLVNNIIPKNKLETMIGDHIRDAIIAVNSCETENKEIFVILGIKDKKYELAIYDTGIEFEIETLLKLGLEQVTTHEDTGGSGIGYLTTFETLKETKASLIIKEEPFKEIGHFTKSVTIRFDNKNQYKICSYRADEIKSKNKGRKIIIEKLENEEANA